MLNRLLGEENFANENIEEDEDHDEKGMLCNKCREFDEIHQIKQLITQNIFTTPEVIKDQAECLQKSKKFIEFSSLNLIGHVSPTAQGEMSFLHEFSNINISQELQLDNDEPILEAIT